MSCEKLINDKGIICFIQPHRFISADFGKGLRNYFNSNKYLKKIISFSDIDIFESANTYTGIFFLDKKTTSFIEYFEFQNVSNNYIQENLFRIIELEKINYSDLTENWNFKNSATSKFLIKLLKLENLNFFAKNISQGVIPGSDKIYYFEIIEEKSNTFIIKNFNQEIEEIEKDLVKKIIKGNNVEKYVLPSNDYFIIYPYQLFNGTQTLISEDYFISNYPKTFQYLLKHKVFLTELRIKYKTNPLEWYGFHRPREMRFFESAKILTTHASIKPNFTISNNDFFNQNVYGIELNDGLDIKYIICLLNSNLTNFIMKNISSMINGGYYLYKSDYLKQIPIVIFLNKQPFIEKANLMLSLSKEFQETSFKFSNYFSKQYKIEKPSGRLEKWYELEFSVFIKELNKFIRSIKGTVLTKKDEFEWIDLFEENKQKALQLKSKIDSTDKDIDQMVYKLYDLTDEEIKIVEG